MRVLGTFLILLPLAAGPVSSARFSVDGLPSATLATLQARNGAPNDSWIRIYFYASAKAADRANASSARDLTRSKWSAVLQLTVDTEGTVWQVDLSLPGHTCTIAASDGEARDVLQIFQFDGKRVRLRGRGSHVCDLRSLKVADQTFEWDVDLGVPVATITP
jgi:hypothetical protein